MHCLHVALKLHCVCSKTKMEMTTPVISTGGQQGAHGDKMQFPIERKYGEDPETLPLPNDSKYELIWHFHMCDVQGLNMQVL